MTSRWRQSLYIEPRNVAGNRGSTSKKPTEDSYGRSHDHEKEYYKDAVQDSRGLGACNARVHYRGSALLTSGSLGLLSVEADTDGFLPQKLARLDRVLC